MDPQIEELSGRQTGRTDPDEACEHFTDAAGGQNFRFNFRNICRCRADLDESPLKSNAEEASKDKKAKEEKEEADGDMVRLSPFYLEFYI